MNRRNDNRRTRWAGLLLACVGIWALADSARGQTSRLDPRSRVSPFGVRYDALRLICGDDAILNLKLGSIAQFLSNSEPERWIVIAMGDSQTLREVLPDPESFVRAGGTLLLASDHDSDYLEWAGVQFRAGPVEVALDQDAYLRIPTCPVVRNLEADSPLFRGVLEVILNQAGRLSGPGCDQFACAWFPATVAGVPAGSLPAVAAIEVGRGRALAVSDQSLFTNEMIREGDNLGFAHNAVRWLINDRPADRVQVLFLENGQPIDAWIDPRFEEGDWPLFDSETLLALLNEMAVQLEQEDVFNKLIQSGQASIGPDTVRRLAVLLITLATAILLCRWLLKSRSQPPDFAPALKVDAEGPFVARRYKELLATKSFREPARQLCRQFFIETLGPVDWSKDAIDVAQDASFWTRWRTQRRLQRLWSLADGTLSHRISHARFLRIASEISTLRDELKRGVTQLHVRQKSNGPKPTI